MLTLFCLEDDALAGGVLYVCVYCMCGDVVNVYIYVALDLERGSI